jgi:hypothetical protein
VIDHLGHARSLSQPAQRAKPAGHQGWLDKCCASFEAAALRPPQDEVSL